MSIAKQRAIEIFKKDPVIFAKVMCGVELTSYQKKFILDRSKRKIFVSARQVGKSHIASIEALWYAFTNPNKKILIIAPVERQAKIIYNKIYEMILANPILRAECTKLTLSETVFNNGSRIMCLPAGRSGELIRGYTLDMLIVDEAQLVNDDVFVSVMPSLMVRDGIMILLGTPMGREGFFYEAWQSNAWSKHRVTVYESPFANKKFVEEFKQTHSEVDFKREMLAEFVDYEETYFDLGLVNELAILTRKAEPDHYTYDIYMGLDLARLGSDETVLTAVGVRRDVEEAPIEMLNFWWRSKRTLSDTIGWVKKKVAEWNPQYLVVDESGMGAGVYDLLREDLGDVVRGFNFAKHKLRFELYENLRKLIEDKKILLINDNKLISQFSGFKVGYRADGGITIRKEGKHDDCVDSLALACWGIDKCGRVSVLNVNIDDVFVIRSGGSIW